LAIENAIPVNNERGQENIAKGMPISSLNAKEIRSIEYLLRYKISLVCNVT
jgi:hypothetical protein